MLFIVVNIIHSEFDSNKIPTAYFKPWGCDYLLLPKCDCLGRPRCDCLVFYLPCCLFYPLFQPQTVIKKSKYSVARSYIKISRYFSQIKRTCIKSVLIILKWISKSSSCFLIYYLMVNQRRNQTWGVEQWQFIFIL